MIPTLEPSRLRPDQDDEAGVNRGFVYHYSGLRRELLRAALRKDAGRRLKKIRSGGKLPFAARWRRFL